MKNSQEAIKCICGHGKEDHKKISRICAVILCNCEEFTPLPQKPEGEKCECYCHKENTIYGKKGIMSTHNQSFCPCHQPPAPRKNGDGVAHSAKCPLLCDPLVGCAKPEEQKEPSWEKEFYKQFAGRFIQIARDADRRDDKAYGHGLARLEIDIEKFIASERESFADKILEAIGEEKVFNGKNSNEGVKYVSGYNLAKKEIREKIAKVKREFNLELPKQWI